MSDKKFNFEKTLNELQKITEFLETNPTDLDETLKKFKHGMELAQQLKKRLNEIENTVKTIKQTFDENDINIVFQDSDSENNTD